MFNNKYLLNASKNSPLSTKEYVTAQVIHDWYKHWDGMVYVLFSGGKDSTVLLHMVRKLYPDVLAVFINTGLEYPEVVDFVKTIDNVKWIKPKRTYRHIINDYGYPVISKQNAQKIYEIRNTKSAKLRNLRLNSDDSLNRLARKWHFMIDAPFKISHQCCKFLKIAPVTKFERISGLKQFNGAMACDSDMKRRTFIKQGANDYTGKIHKSAPLSIWNDGDIWEYVKKYDVKVSGIYKLGHNRTGCMYCLYGAHMEKGLNRFQLMKMTHPKQYIYAMKYLKLGKVLTFMNINH